MAAGQGFKTFTTGEVLTAGDVNGYLMQGINVFTNSTARDAAITAPAEGQFAFTKDNNSLWYYDGAAWVASGATGDIEGVTATSPLTGGGTSGTVTVGIQSASTSQLGAVQLSDSISSTSTSLAATANAVKTAYDNAIPKSLIDAAGDLIVGTAADTAGRLAIGSTGQVLTVSGGAPVWASAAGGGKVLQVVYGSYATESSSTSTTYADSGLSLSITPSSTNSKVLVFISQNLGMDRAGFGQYVRLQLLRTSTSILELGGGTYKQAWGMEAYDGGVTYNKLVGAYPVVYLDSPSTASSVTYKTQFAVGQQPGGPTATAYVQPSSNTSTIILMEIGV